MMLKMSRTKVLVTMMMMMVDDGDDNDDKLKNTGHFGYHEFKMKK